MKRCLILAAMVTACGSVNATYDAATGDGRQSDGGTDSMPACGAAGQACCTNNACGTGLSCTTGDQVCRAAQVWIGGTSSSGAAVIAHGSGTTFTTDTLGTGNVVAVWGTSASDVWALANSPAAASQSSFLRHWNGNVWETVVNVSGFYYAIWGDAPDNYWAVNNSGGAIHYNGTSWSTPMTVSANVVFTQLWGSAATDVWAIGQNTVAHWDGSGNWTPTTRTDFSVVTRVSISGRKSGDMYSGGESASAPAVLHRSGTTFTVEPLPGCGDARAVWVGPDDAWALTGPLIPSGSCVSQPTVAHLESGTWTNKGMLPNATTAQGMWGSSNRDLYVAGANAAGAAVFHYDGTSWSAAYTPASSVATNFYPVWGTGGSN